MRIKDSPSSFSSQSSGAVRFTANNPFDNFIFHNGSFFPLELKSTKNTSLSIQREKSEKGKMIKLHQINGLLEASSYAGVYAGFIVDFRSTGCTYFINIKDFKNFLDDTEKKSINESDIVSNNGILLEKKLLKVNYCYDIAKLLKDIVDQK